MPTMAPPDEISEQRFARIDERFDHVDADFARVNERIVEVNRRITETNRRISEGKEGTDRRFKELNRRIDENTAEVKGLRQEMNALQTTFQRGNYTLVATIIGAVLALLIKGG
jgi:chromosome segregation ATPase